MARRNPRTLTEEIVSRWLQLLLHLKKNVILPIIIVFIIINNIGFLLKTDITISHYPVNIIDNKIFAVKSYRNIGEKFPLETNAKHLIYLYY